MKLRPATPEDFGFIRRLTTDPANAPYLGDDDTSVLAAYLADPAARVLIWGEDTPAGFAIFREIGNASGRVELFRLALAQAGGGAGAAFTAALCDFAFGELAAKRIWLDASGENPRACKVYERAGFQLEGCLRGHWYRPALGRSVDLLLFGLMREDWQAAVQPAVQPLAAPLP
jgi:RimJ/RimL family protein N-acetyltransferase